jgi:hypothetical protein
LPEVEHGAHFLILHYPPPLRSLKWRGGSESGASTPSGLHTPSSVTRTRSQTNRKPSAAEEVDSRAAVYDTRGDSLAARVPGEALSAPDQVRERERQRERERDRQRQRQRRERQRQRQRERDRETERPSRTPFQHTLTSEKGSHRQCRRNDSTELCSR